jgi:hypothetical protein
MITAADLPDMLDHALGPVAPIESEPYKPPHADGLCDWCFWPMNGDVAEFNQGKGHSTCVVYIHELLTDDSDDAEALPWPYRLTSTTPTGDFFRRLAIEAAKEGINSDRLARAIERAEQP